MAHQGQRASRLVTLALGLGSVLWLALIFAGDVRFVVFAPTAKAGAEVVIAVVSLFGGLVLLLFPDEAARQRLRWAAAGFLLLGLAGLLYGYLYPLIVDQQAVNATLYAGTTVRLLTGLILVIGLLPRRPPPLSVPLLLAAVAGGTLAGGLLLLLGHQLPSLSTASDFATAARQRAAGLHDLTGWYWPLALASLGLALAAVPGAVRLASETELGSWLLLAMTARVGAELHTLFWPATFTEIVTTATVLRLLFALIVAVGGMLELRRVAQQRAAFLAVQEEQGRRLIELAVLRADFTRMLTHELNNPLAAISQLGAVAQRVEDRALQREALVTLQTEVLRLRSLVADVQSAATVERDDFLVAPRPVPLVQLFAEAVAYGRALPGAHPVCAEETAEWVLADPERIGQLLRNLVSNAAKYSPEGVPIRLRAAPMGSRVRLEVIDMGYGIHPDDLGRIFEKFGRGRDLQGRPVPGLGVGLYLSRRLAQAHGSELAVTSQPGTGSTFSFSLERADPLL